ncbi:hypothetical protein FIBSPDRAFT_952021 [Athelia psychrophila]|uniref:BTB domain-containing protein n=1 Tax=Athelia psychrophila TaxID=1759441 RepID=A0A166M041_9AGAM|nr:hypothetical protein FIBSPDRAFT_952021 [Fibularhizoctonia sp. CBS 109695]
MSCTAASPTKRKRANEQTRLAPVNRSDIWFHDGNIVLQAERTQFKIHGGILAQSSTVFNDMLSIPQPLGPAPAYGMVEGCPVVQLSDSAEDVTFVLKALSQRGYAATGKPVTIEVVAAFLRLGKKYDIEVLRVEALERIFSEVATTVDEMLSNTNKPKRLIEAGFFRNLPLPWVDILNLAREHDLQSVLPLALYECCRLFDKGAAFSTTRNMSEFAISTSDQILIAAGPRRIIKLQNETTFVWASADPGIVRCRTAASCSCYLLNILRDEFVTGLYIRGTDSWEEPGYDLCQECRTNGEAEQNRGRQQFWDSLPGLFGLPEWAELRLEREKLLAPWYIPSTSKP